METLIVELNVSHQIVEVFDLLALLNLEPGAIFVLSIMALILSCLELLLLQCLLTLPVLKVHARQTGRRVFDLLHDCDLKLSKACELLWQVGEFRALIVWLSVHPLPVWLRDVGLGVLLRWLCEANLHFGPLFVSDLNLLLPPGTCGALGCAGGVQLLLLLECSLFLPLLFA